MKRSTIAVYFLLGVSTVSLGYNAHLVRELNEIESERAELRKAAQDLLAKTQFDIPAGKPFHYVDIKDPSLPKYPLTLMADEQHVMLVQSSDTQNAGVDRLVLTRVMALKLSEALAVEVGPGK